MYSCIIEAFFTISSCTRVSGCMPVSGTPACFSCCILSEHPQTDSSEHYSRGDFISRPCVGHKSLLDYLTEDTRGKGLPVPF